MKKFIFKLYLFYFKFSPINRGKQFLAIMLSRIFGSNLHKAKNGIWIDIYLKSTQDIYLVTFDGNDTLTDIIKNLHSESIFIDIGANIGYYSFLASQKFGNNGKVFCFEPSYREYNRLLKGIQKNNLQNIIPINACLSNISGELLMDIDESHTGLNKIHIPGSTYSTINQVAVFRFDDLQELFQLKKIDLVKIDVEGAEYLVLMGMIETLKKGLIKKVFIEITPSFLYKYGHTKEHIYNFMTNCGFISSVNSDEWQYDEIFILENRISNL